MIEAPPSHFHLVSDYSVVIFIDLLKRDHIGHKELLRPQEKWPIVCLEKLNLKQEKEKKEKKTRRTQKKKVLSAFVSQGRANSNVVDSRTVVQQTVIWVETVTSPTYLMMSMCSVPELQVL